MGYSNRMEWLRLNGDFYGLFTEFVPTFTDFSQVYRLLQTFLEFYQLYYDPFITNCLEILQNCPDPRFSALPIHDALTTILTRFRLTSVNRFRQQDMSQFLRHFFFESTLFDTRQIRSPADPRC